MLPLTPSHASWLQVLQASSASSFHGFSSRLPQSANEQLGIRTIAQQRAKFGPSCFFLSWEKNSPSFFAWRKEKHVRFGFRKSTWQYTLRACPSFCLPIPFFLATSSGCVGRCFATQRVPWQHWFSCEKHLPWTARKTIVVPSQIAWVA